jgi:hypothetical protein
MIAAALLPGSVGASTASMRQQSRTVSCGSGPPSRARLYSKTSPFNRPISSRAQIDPESSAMTQGIVDATRERPLVLSVKAFTVPVFYARKKTRRSFVSLTAPWAARRSIKIPIPATARPDPSLDGFMSIVDRSTRCEYDLWQASKGADGHWSASWANRISTGGSGIFRHGNGGRASGFAFLAGLIFPESLKGRRIDHALVLSYPDTRAGPPVSPATSSDGKGRGPNTIPLGARIQLDPTLDLSQLQLRPYEQTIARALQVYGAFVAETGGAVSLFAAHPYGYRRNPYAGLLPDVDYVSLDRIPLDRLRVLKMRSR